MKPSEAKIAVKLGTLLFNVSFSKCFEKAYNKIGMTVFGNLLAEWECIQDEKIKKQTEKEQTEEDHY